MGCAIRSALGPEMSELSEIESSGGERVVTLLSRAADVLKWNRARCRSRATHRAEATGWSWVRSREQDSRSERIKAAPLVVAGTLGTGVLRERATACTVGAEMQGGCRNAESTATVRPDSWPPTA